MYREQIDAYIDAHKEQLIDDVMKLVRIDSQRTQETPGKPYGEGPAEVLEAAKELMDSYGFATRNYENRVVTGDFNEKEKQLDILAHLDVVPVTKDWTVTDPFQPVIRDGKIYGRGTADDKGPAMAALYAMKAVKDLGIELDYNVRLILGSDEECGSSDLVYYYEVEKEAPMSFTPDADFPVINIEKGHFSKKFHGEFEDCDALPKIVKIHGGDKVNVVPANAEAVILGLEEQTALDAAKKAQDETKVKFTVTKNQDEIVITAKGVAGHASTPEVGNSALTALLQLLAGLPVAPGRGFEKIRALAKLFPHNDYYGKGMGVEMEDEISGKLTMNLGVFQYTPTSINGQFDSRVPICGTEENVTQVGRAKMEEAGLVMEEGPMTPPHHVPGDSLFVQTLLGSYEAYTGIKGEPLAIGGGTYVHGLERGVAFGCMIPEVDNHMHGDDEFMDIDMLIMSTKIFADVIVKLCNK